jgi:hypothetical protein
MSDVNNRQGRRFVFSISSFASWQKDLTELDGLIRHTSTLQARSSAFFILPKLDQQNRWQGDFLLGRQVYGSPIDHAGYKWIDIYGQPKHHFSAEMGFFDTKDLQNWVNQQIMSCSDEQGEWLISYQECYDQTQNEHKILLQLEFFAKLSL